MKEILNKLSQYNILTQEEAKEILLRIGKGEFNNSHLAAFMAMFMMRPVTVEELGGFRDALMELCVPIDLSAYDGMDLCGTGGDGKNTFNISTLSAFVVAACGQNVVKHGNYGVSSKCGSSNLLEHFGYEFTNQQDILEKQLNEAGICFLHAPKFHPAMKHVGPIRKELGIKTFFNMLGPLVNPAKPKKQMAGVFDHELARIYAYLFQETDVKYGVVYDLAGYDECSLTSQTKVFSNTGEAVITPEDFNLNKFLAEEIYGGETIEEAASIFVSILKGEGTNAQNQVVYANTALALQAAGKYTDLKEGALAAREAIRSGKAIEIFNKLIKR
ncbi:anthranilate phosphoribosyltransferase [Marivirga lumbricoides]|uniref:Anthranilate phosphoribosyltransferase n=1 Tax=Marivirga lumbricoides TaxID=1046115 RepID=A0A2T4DVJ3_9BACT|nr:anthranilate phosphoribosyltransferase [Marivirga lumbricoides]